jgi:hypothetical protein
MEEDPLIQGESSTSASFLTSGAVEGEAEEAKGIPPVDHQEEILSAESIKPAVVDPWLPISSEGVSSSSPTKEDGGGFNSTSVEQWLNTQVVGFDQDQFIDSNMSPPATTTSGGGGDSSGGSKNQKGRACVHLVKGVSTPGLRKAFKADIKATCSKPSCLISISVSNLHNFIYLLDKQLLLNDGLFEIETLDVPSMWSHWVWGQWGTRGTC